ncbi:MULTISPECIES: helix-turn-helix domain-containing protein [Aliiruegeria]|uniref:DNA binding domain-containing protein, excisionase family n=1 Tax=Aliiruegeria lutimaris TaxID=571298 RepID=A0A1G9QDI3_9RHOB|nr:MULTISPECIES: helix-turn-helix domain-containing protein [Aliiruegeria]NDR55681.1 helix-turn-helix domain-containing protein [Pseudoruegeria sp. M32A2M]SDM09059.1 DNA binding domain-containing protein, excisionase family [Aliiruegeria lutimaris]
MADLPFDPHAKYLTVKEVAALFRICPKTVRRWIDAGELAATKPGGHWRIARADLKALAAARGNRGLADVL